MTCKGHSTLELHFILWLLPCAVTQSHTETGSNLYPRPVPSAHDGGPLLLLWELSQLSCLCFSLCATSSSRERMGCLTGNFCCAFFFFKSKRVENKMRKEMLQLTGSSEMEGQGGCLMGDFLNLDSGVCPVI